MNDWDSYRWVVFYCFVNACSQQRGAKVPDIDLLEDLGLELAHAAFCAGALR